MAIQYFKTLGVFLLIFLRFDITERFSNSLNSKYRLKYKKPNQKKPKQTKNKTNSTKSSENAKGR